MLHIQQNLSEISTMVLPNLTEVNDVVYLSVAVGCITMWLVPHVGIEICGYRATLVKSPSWQDDALKQGNKSITQTAIAASVGWVIVYAATAVGVGLSTQNLDSRATSIIYGLSLLVGSVVFFSLSCKTPKWLGVYYSEKSSLGEPVGRTLKHLRFNLAWSIGRIFLSMYILVTLFFCGAAPETIPVSTLLGIFGGFIVYYGVYFGRTTFNGHKRSIAFVMATVLSILSAACLGIGCGYIQEVWGSIDVSSVTNLFLIIFFSALIAGFVIHYLLWRHSKKMFEKRAIAENEGHTIRPFKYQTQLFVPHILKKWKLLDEQEEKLENEKKMSKVEEGRDESNSVGNGDDETGLFANNASEEESGDEEGHKMRTDSDNNEGGGEDKIDQEQEEDIEGGSATEGLGELSNDQDDPKDETTWDLFKLKCCGNAEKSGEYPKKNCCQTFVSILRWIVWIGVNGLFLYVIIVNIGASVQTDAVMTQLPASYAFLYPPNYGNGTTCAWNAPGENATFMTFNTSAEAIAANYEIVHCGACGACSNWNDLMVYWNTRSTLKHLSHQCATKSLFGGVESVQACNRDSIGFTEECAWCWTEDELCAKSKCVFIFLQGLIINKLANFTVGPGEITSATCDEAMCGPVFGPCSGAIRRRMNIKSGIERPPSQQCRTVSLDWAEDIQFLVGTTISAVPVGIVRRRGVKLITKNFISFP